MFEKFNSDGYACYQNNLRLKACNVEMDLSKEDFDEYLKCANDPVYFARKYVKIVNIDLGLINFDLRDYQEELIGTILDNRFTICKMARQTGKSTTVCAYLLWDILFHPDQSVGILANKQALAIDIMDRLKLAYEHLPWFLQQGVVTWNKKQIELENGSKCLAGSTSSSSVRGMSLTTILLDEFAHIKSNLAEEFFESVYPTISSGKNSKIIMVSTPNGMNMFHKLWTESEQGLNTYARVEVHWSQVPGRDEAWKRETIANTSVRQFAQEQETEFLGSANTLITGFKLRQLTHSQPIREISTLHTDDKLEVYHEPEDKHLYVMTVDISEGVGLDYAAIGVFDITGFPYIQVATYSSNNISELLLPDVIRAVGIYYNQAMVLIENNTGREVANTLEMDLEYENIVSVGKDIRMGQIAGGGFGKSNQNGVKMSKSVKRIGCTTLKTLIEEDKLLLNDYDTIQELFNFVESKGSYAADGSGHDDMVITLVLFSWLTSQEYFKELCDLDLRARLMAERAKQAEEEVLPFFCGNHDENDTFVDNQGTTWSHDSTNDDWGRF